MKETEAIRFGRAYHAFVLTPGEFQNEYFVMNDIEVYAQLINKGYKSPRMTKEYKEWAAAEGVKAGARTTIDGEQYQKMVDMSAVLTSYPFARKLLQGGVAEIGYAGTIETIAGEIEIKMKPDYVNNDKAVIVDLKTAADSSAAGFARAAASYDYHIQAAFYKDMMQLKDATSYSFFFVAQETEKPYAVNVFEASDQFINQGKYEYELLLSLYKYCLDNNRWPSYEVFNQNKYGIQQLDLPAYAIKPLDYYTH
jgi:exodeoxyribonuclease VIII